MTVANATSASSPLYASFSAVKYKEKYNVTIVAEYDPDTYFEDTDDRTLVVKCDDQTYNITGETTITAKTSKIDFTGEGYLNGGYVTDTHFQKFYIYNSNTSELLYAVGIDWSDGNGRNPMLNFTLDITEDTSLLIVMKNGDHVGGGN